MNVFALVITVHSISFNFNLVVASQKLHYTFSVAVNRLLSKSFHDNMGKLGKYGMKSQIKWKSMEPKHSHTFAIKTTFNGHNLTVLVGLITIAVEQCMEHTQLINAFCYTIQRVSSMMIDWWICKNIIECGWNICVTWFICTDAASHIRDISTDG